MESFENELYICLKDKMGNYLPFYNIKGNFSNNMKGGGLETLEKISSILNYDEFQKNLKKQNNDNNHIEEIDKLGESEKIKSVSFSDDEGSDNDNLGGEKNNDEIETNSIIPQDFVNYFNKKIQNY